MLHYTPCPKCHISSRSDANNKTAEISVVAHACLIMLDEHKINLTADTDKRNKEPSE